MPGIPRNQIEDTPSIAEARLVDRLCDRFDAVWQVGGRPAIEAFLAEAPMGARGFALRELICVEVEYRTRDGETPQPEEYESRFRDSLEIVNEAFQRAGCRTDHNVAPAVSLDTPATMPTLTLEEKATWSAPLLPGFQIVGKIGAGGMGVVYKAQQLSLHRVVAVKMIRHDLLAGPHLLARFKREAEIAARLQHPHVVQIHEVGECAGQPYAVLEFVEGSTLAQLIASGLVSPQEAVALVEKLCRAVQHAHENGILHRDLKPANVLLTIDGTPKIADFGLARWLGKSSDETMSGEVIGTPTYMAPEQALAQPNRLSPATDVYALGAILYELLAGRPAFRGNTPLETLEHVRSSAPVALRYVRPNVSRDLETICLKCLEKEPASRYSSARELGKDLNRFLEGKPILARKTRWAVLAWKRVKRRPLVCACFFLAAFLAVAVPIYRHANDPERQIEAIERRLDKGEKVALILEKGRPSWYRIRTGADATQVSLAEDGTFVVNTWTLCLIELVRDPRCLSYRIRAEVRHDNNKTPGEVGVFFGLEGIPTTNGTAFSFGEMSFDDIESVEDIWNGIPLPPQRKPPRPKGNPVFLRPFLYDHRPTGRRRTQRLSGLSPVDIFKPAGHAGGRWRSLTLVVTPHSVRGTWDGNHVLGEVTREAWDAQVHKGVAGIDPTSAISHGLWLRGAIGLYVYNGTASFRNVSVEPLGN